MKPAGLIERDSRAALANIRVIDANRPETHAPAVEALCTLVGTHLERRALAACLVAHAGSRAPPELRCLAAETFARRGSVKRALRLLNGLAEPRAWLLEADLRAELGQQARAVQLIERVLAHDIDAPGALERWQRWQPPAVQELPGAQLATLLTAEPLHTSLEIISEAGRGGAATVYVAKDTLLERRVALKVYHQPERQREQLLREATLAVALAGSGIVRVFDADPEHGWVAMEWADEGSLEQRVARPNGDLWPDAWAWVPAFVEVLARVHRAGFVHADLKPANILFRRDGRALLADFGLAVPIGAPHLGSSIGYVSPERAAGAPASPADDLYALGRVLQRLLEASSPMADELVEWRRLAQHLESPARPLDAAAVSALVPTRNSEPK